MLLKIKLMNTTVQQKAVVGILAVMTAMTMTTIITEEWISLIQAVHIVVIKVEMEDREAMEDPLEMFLFLVLLLGY